MRSFFSLILLAAAACGSAPKNLGYTNGGIIAVLAGTPLTPLTPRVDYGAKSYQIIPAPPPGITFDTTSGVLAGTPTTPQPVTRYEVVAKNSVGVDSTTISITVLTVLPATFVYATPDLVVAENSSIPQDVPTLQAGGAAFSIEPALPTGMSLDASSGAIYGRPTVAQAQTSYTVSAKLAGATATAPLTITVNAL